MTRKQPKPDTLINITSEVVYDHYRIKNWIAREWSPIIGPHALMLYNIYSSAANKERGNSWYFSIRTLQEFTFFSMTTINMYNWLLEACGLIRIKSGTDGYANEYVILDPPHVTQENLKKLVAMLEADADVGKNWQAFKQNAIDRITKWKPLTECGKASQYKRGVIEAQKEAGQIDLFTNGNGIAPKPSAAAEPLVARLVEYFADNKPKLTEKGAKNMVELYGAEAVDRQMTWLKDREIESNELKTLRAALRDDWPEPHQRKEAKAWYAGNEDAIKGL